MRIKPRFTYSGLSVVLSNPSRQDTIEKKLLAGWAGSFFNDECLRPEFNVNQVEVRTSDTLSEGLLEGTKAILLLGERAMHEWTGGLKYLKYNLDELRGTPLDNQWKLPCIASYLPQDCVDFVNHEKKHNPLAQYEKQNEGELKEDSTEKHKGKTSRDNYRFWLIRDTKKIIQRIFSDKISLSINSTRKFRCVISPKSEDIISRLRETKNSEVVLDIETDELRQITCIGLGIHNMVYVVPFCRFDYSLAYSDLYKILGALAICGKYNTTVCHNSLFDLLILADKYHIPIGKSNYDTMLAWHRCFPEAEKSLGHLISAFTWEPYHKDEGIFMPQNAEQERKLWEYNAKDIIGTMLCKEAIDKYAKTIPGLTESIEHSNKSIRPFLINTLQGIRFDESKRQKIMQENDRLCAQYLRFIKVALGNELFLSIKGKSEASLASSPSQAVKYFHDIMKYKSVGKTPKGGPSLAADNMYKLQLKYPENVIIDLVLAFRERAKETGSLKFNPWKT